jgi:hypothetical protein
VLDGFTYYESAMNDRTKKNFRVPVHFYRQFMHPSFLPVVSVELAMSGRGGWSQKANKKAEAEKKPPTLISALGVQRLLAEISVYRKVGLVGHCDHWE